MKRRSFLRNSALAAGVVSLAIPASGNRVAPVGGKSFFEFRVYHVSRASNARSLLDQFIKDALIPFVNKHGGKVAAFTEYSLEEPVKIYVLIAYPDATAYFRVQAGWFTDPLFLETSRTYNSIPASEAVYTRYETFLLEAFDSFPGLTVPSEKKGLYELRIYEGASEDAVRRKIAMFNLEEIALFLKVGLMPLFFGRIMAGEFMPALAYMVGFKDMADRDATWNRFGSHEDWNTMRVKPEYADTVSNIRRIFLIPTPYSQV